MRELTGHYYQNTYKLYETNEVKSKIKIVSINQWEKNPEYNVYVKFKNILFSPHIIIKK